MLIKKFFKLFTLFFTNNGKFYYLFNHYCNATVKNKRALKIKNNNEYYYEKNKIEKFSLDTYDLSNQYTHPDLIFWNNLYWLIVTPYPYGIEAYENPCLYYSSDLTSFTPFEVNPIAFQYVVKRGVHLSDPFFGVFDDNLLVLFRDNMFKEGEQWVSIKYKIMNKSLSFSGLKTLIEGTEDFLSPIFFKVGELYYLQYMNKTNNDTEITEICYNNRFDIVSKNNIKTVGFPDDFYFWHFGIDHNLFSINSLVLLRNKNDNNDFILCEANYNNDLKTWFYTKKIILDSAFTSNIDHIYKSCFFTNENKILISFKDKKGRYYCKLIYNGE
ncbi:MAG: hypothetical protein K5765_00500 [Clostridia bacterium]|nr:hypothetical protein [Clostridia bacterium]